MNITEHISRICPTLENRYKEMLFSLPSNGIDRKRKLAGRQYCRCISVGEGPAESLNCLIVALQCSDVN